MGMAPGFGARARLLSTAPAADAITAAWAARFAGRAVGSNPILGRGCPVGYTANSRSQVPKEFLQRRQ